MTEQQLQSIRSTVFERFRDFGYGHGFDHFLRVEVLALKFLPETDDRLITSAVALLHDVDDYKLQPSDADPNELVNATEILIKANISIRDATYIKDCLKTIGYSKRLAGIVPDKPEAMAVSDADMCDLMGASGILRMAEYDRDASIPFFDPSRWPNLAKSADEYKATIHETTGVEHMFEKILRLPDLMLTAKGRIEGVLRWKTNIMFLRSFFKEQDQPQWEAYLEEYLKHYMSGDLHSLKEGGF